MSEEKTIKAKLFAFLPPIPFESPFLAQRLSSSFLPDNWSMIHDINE